MAAEAAFAVRAARLAGIAGAAAGWPPDQFWRATPAELEAVLRTLAGEGAGAGAGAAPPDRAAVAALMREFPDG